MSWCGYLSKGVRVQILRRANSGIVNNKLGLFTTEWSLASIKDTEIQIKKEQTGALSLTSRRTVDGQNGCIRGVEPIFHNGCQ